MSRLAPHFKAASQSRVLVGINQTHSFDYPQNNIIKYLSKLTQTVDVLRLAKALEAPRRLAGHLGGCDIELSKSSLFDGDVRAALLLARVLAAAGNARERLKIG